LNGEYLNQGGGIEAEACIHLARDGQEKWLIVVEEEIITGHEQ
jgi:hypothetical protein